MTEEEKKRMREAFRRAADDDDGITHETPKKKNDIDNDADEEV